MHLHEATLKNVKLAREIEVMVLSDSSAKLYELDGLPMTCYRCL